MNNEMNIVESNGQHSGDGETPWTDKDLKDKAASMLEPQELRENQAHFNGLLGRSYSYVDDGPIRHVAANVLGAVFNKEDSDDSWIEDFRRRLATLNPRSLAKDVLNQPSRSNAEMSDARKSLLACRQAEDMSRGVGTEASDLHAQLKDGAIRRQKSIIEKLERKILLSPKTSQRCLVELRKLTTSSKAPREPSAALLKKVRQISDRWLEVEGLSDQLTSGVQRQTQKQFRAVALAAIENARNEIVLSFADRAISDARPLLLGEVARLEKQIREVQRLRKRTLTELMHSDDLSSGSGREVKLACPDTEAVREVVLQTNGVTDVEELASVWRRELGPILSLLTNADIGPLAQEAFRRIAEGSGRGSIYACICDTEQATQLCSELLERAHVMGSIQLCEEELGVLPTDHSSVELPLATNARDAELRELMVGDLRRTTCNRIRVIDRPAHVRVIAITRWVIGFPSECDRTNQNLKEAYVALRKLAPQFSPHPFSSELVGESGYLEFTAHCNGSVETESSV